ncbi:MAG: methyltransferase, TIGR04325 family [archaeon]
MSLNLKPVILLIPRPILSAYRRHFSKSTKWVGNYMSWDEALKHSKGYDSGEILSKVISAMHKVKKGEAAFERDSVVFHFPEYDWDLLSVIFAVAENSKKVVVLDFGGALGNLYYKNKHFLKQIKGLFWGVVEQPEFVKAGKKEFESKSLKFYDSIGDFSAGHKPSVAVFSSVLQYIEDPFAVLRTTMNLAPQFMIISRTPMIKGKSRICVQKVNPKIYDSSYPCRIFDEDELYNLISKKYLLMSEEVSNDYYGGDFVFKTLIFKRK